MRQLVACALAGASSLALARPSALPAPPAAPPRPATIQVTGEARVSQAPDRAYIEIGVTTQARDSEAAVSENATRLTAVVAAVKHAAGPGAQLTTSQYSIDPNYNYPRDGTSVLVGYTATNVITVRLDDLPDVSRVIDAATQAGANRVQDIRFALRDEQAPRSGAFREAALNAKRDAEALAGALGLKVVRVLAVSEQSPEGRPVPIYAQAVTVTAARAVATPIEAGTVDINAAVTLTVEVAPAKR